MLVQVSQAKRKNFSEKSHAASYKQLALLTNASAFEISTKTQEQVLFLVIWIDRKDCQFVSPKGILKTRTISSKSSNVYSKLSNSIYFILFLKKEILTEILFAETPN